jgi:hypothetical protein
MEPFLGSDVFEVFLSLVADIWHSVGVDERDESRCFCLGEWYVHSSLLFREGSGRFVCFDSIVAEVWAIHK